MGIFDKFKKKDDFAFPTGNSNSNAGLGEPPIDSHSSLDQPAGSSDIFTAPVQVPSSQPTDPRMSMPLGESVQPSLGAQTQSQGMSQHATQPHSSNPIKQDFELISSKLDYLKASIEAINQRLANIEHLVKQEQDKKKW
ncbi:hypothetical protein HN789_02840 [archaeon]|jgi:hypothetical protein|nr:hypothetical protein [archaeon]MBT3721447.1 hypothetical protein [archaeon]MBT4021995.1 hypothetical protein [archaeon]MBT4272311.1 hypothetical protein [archaeon]MBT4460847.1 hypothetical protein [archaeon]